MNTFIHSLTSELFSKVRLCRHCSKCWGCMVNKEHMAPVLPESASECKCLGGEVVKLNKQKISE